MMLYDATLPITKEIVTFPGDPPFQTEPVLRIRKGDPFNLARFSMGTHAGTHVDPPAHCLEDGTAVDELPLEILVGAGVVIDLRGHAQIDRRALSAAAIGDHERILFKTDNGPRLLESSFHHDFVGLTEDGARYLLEKNVRLVGIDYLSIERHENPNGPVHHILLEAGVVLVEGLHLLDIAPGEYEIFCLPIKIKGADGAPARVVLRG